MGHVFVDLEAQLAARPSTARLAEAFVRANGRVRRRPMAISRIYRYPRGRTTDALPLSPALSPSPLPPPIHVFSPR